MERAPSAGDLAASQQRWRTWRNVAGVAIVAGFIGIAVSTSWWYVQWQANTRLQADGEPVTAEVIDVDPGESGSLTVEFEFEGRTITRRLYPALLESFTADHEGRYISVIFDPAHPEAIAEPGKANWHPLTFLFGIVGAGSVLIGSVRANFSRRALRMSTATLWTPATLNLQRGRFSLLEPYHRKPARLQLTLAEDSPTLHAEPTGTGGQSWTEARALFAEDDKWALVIPDNSGRAILAKKR